MAGVPIPVTANEGYRLWADSWDGTPSPIVALEERMLRPRMEQIHAQRIVDVGCGTGRWTSQLSAIGVDASPEMLAIAAKKSGLAGRLLVAEATALPIATGSVELLLCTLMFGHIRDQATALREFARVLEPGGSLILTDFHPAAKVSGWRRTFKHNGQVYELENYAYAIDWLRAAGTEAGLVVNAWVDATIGEPERELFERAGRPDLFEGACRIPAVLLSRWTRR